MIALYSMMTNDVDWDLLVSVVFTLTGRYPQDRSNFSPQRRCEDTSVGSQDGYLVAAA